MASVEPGPCLGQAWMGALSCLPERAAALAQALLQFQLADAWIRLLKPGSFLKDKVDRCISSLGVSALCRSYAGGLTSLGCV